MPLSDSVPREQIYTRKIECRGYLRSDGLWDIEGHLGDARSYPSHTQFRGDIPAGAPMHEMSMRMTIDEDLTIRAVEATMESTPFQVCSGVTANYQRLVGSSLRSGFVKLVRDRLGGAEGCTHLRELLGPMATTAYQSVFNYRRQQGASEEPDAQKRLLNSCYALSSDSDVVKKRWPDAYTGRR
jgi:hypothetical protein